MNSQYKKGVLDLCVLSLLHRRDCYGYEISDFLSGHIDVADGTVYPLLRKLKNEGLLTTYLQEESGGPPRRVLRASPGPRSGNLSKQQSRISEIRQGGGNFIGG